VARTWLTEDAGGAQLTMENGREGSGGPGYDLSVVISTHNRPEQLREAIAAVRGQDHAGPIETIVVWDKTEPEWDLADDDAHRPVRVLANDRTPGLPGSRNCGAAAALAPVLGFCDDDDLWLPDKARRQLALLEETGADVVSSGFDAVVEGKVVPRRGVESGVLRYADLLRSRRIEANMVTTIVRADAFWGAIGPLYEDIPGGYAEDYDWMLRAARHQPVPVVPDSLVQVRWLVQSHFRQQWPDWEAALAAVVDRNPEFAAEPKGRARIEGQRAVAIAAQGRRGDAVRQIRSTLGWSWREPRAYLAMAVVAGVPAERISGLLSRFGRGI
jgi:hypothetical protein